MTPEDRKTLKQLVDAAVRVQTAFAPRTCCSECGGDYDNVTTGCKRCWDRQRNRKNARDSRKVRA